MKSTNFNLCLTASLMLLMAGCNEENDLLNESSEEEFNELIEEELGAYSFGTLLDIEEEQLIQLEYNGEAIRIPYYVEGWAEAIVAELGWFLFVDGVPQPTHLETIEGEIFSGISYMHHFAIEYSEREEFYVVFTPILGQVGEHVGCHVKT